MSNLLNIQKLIVSCPHIYFEKIKEIKRDTLYIDGVYLVEKIIGANDKDYFDTIDKHKKHVYKKHILVHCV